jgi:alpha-L-rhamnosidase
MPRALTTEHLAAPLGIGTAPASAHPRADGARGGTLVGTAHVVASLQDAAAVADVVGEAGQAAAWRDRATDLTRRFTARFLDAAAGTYGTEVPAGYRQTSNAMPLAAGLVPVTAATARAARRRRRSRDGGPRGAGRASA